MVISLRKWWLKLALIVVLISFCFCAVYYGVKAAAVFWPSIAVNQKNYYEDEKNIINAEYFVLSEYISPVLSDDPGRLHNLRVGINAINRYVIMPDGTISFNRLVKARAKIDGWQLAKDSMVIGTELVDSRAGGVCQVASTLYNAGLLAEFKVIERYPHTLALNYIEPGRDAAIYFEGGQDLRLQNLHSFPVRVEAELKNKRVIVRLVTDSAAGKKWAATHRIEVYTVKEGEIPYETVKIEDPSLPVGKNVVELTGVRGYEYVKVKRIIKQHHEVIQQEIISEDSYEPLPERIRVGVGQTLQRSDGA